FWESTDEPSLKKFLDFRLSSGDIEDRKIEYARYNNELITIARYYAEESAVGRCISSWKNAFMASQSKRSAAIKQFWKVENEKQNILSKNHLVEERAKGKVRNLQAAQHVNIATVATEQIGQYARSTTSIMKRFLDDEQRPGKHVINKVTENLSNNKSDDNNESDLTDGEKSPTEMACERREALSDSRDTIVTVLDGETEAVEALFELSEPATSTSTTPLQALQDLTPLMETPRKRPFQNEQVHRYCDNVAVVCTLGMTVAEMSAEIGEKLAKEISSMRDVKPAIWSPALEQYIDNAIKSKTIADFKRVVLQELAEDEPFYLYCQKILLDLKIGERKYILNYIAPLFRFYEATFMTLDFDWVESHARAAKMMKSSTHSGIVKVDAKASRSSDGLEVWHMEVSGPPCDAAGDHILGDAKKAIRTDILNLVHPPDPLRSQPAPGWTLSRYGTRFCQYALQLQW
ncbi:3035_t:CDS:10, partial [Paraglomus brasilianum]